MAATQAESQSEPQQDTLPVRPRLANDVLVHDPQSAGDKYVLERNGRSFYRVSEDVAILARLLTGDHDQQELVDILGGGWDLQTLQQALRQLESARLLDDGTDRTYAVRRVHVSPPLTLQFSLVDPTRLLERMTVLVHLARQRWVQSLVTASAFVGLAVLGLLHDEVRRVLGSPLDPSALVWLFAASFVFTAFHELAHGAVLVSHGGRPRRMGVMLFYLLPAFFCDVSDGWRLSRRAQRVQVAMAGIFVQAACAGTSALVALGTRGTALGDVALLVAIATYLATTINLIPFVKFDGYIALMSALDIPHLRRATVNDARSAISQWLFGARRERELERWWSVPFGLACILFPLYLVAGVAFFLWTGMFQGLGAGAAFVTLCLVCGIVGGTLAELHALIRHARGLGASFLRITVAGTAVVVAVLFALSVVRVPQSAPGYFERTDDGTVALYLSESAARDVEPGQQVKLRSNGFVIRAQIGEGVVAPGEPTPARVQLDDLTPVMISTGISLELLVLDLEVTDAPNSDRGTARVSTGDRSVLQWLNERYIRPALAF